VMGWGLGAAYRIGPSIELGANFSSPIDITAKGDAIAVQGAGVSIGGTPFEIYPNQDPKCAAGGTLEKQKGCVQLGLPMNATIGGRYKFLDATGVQKGDIELDATWEHWGKTCDFTADPDCHSPGQYRVVVDAMAVTGGNVDQGLELKNNIVAHGLRDTFGVRLGGSYNIPVGDNALIARAGVAYDTAAAKKGWERADFDGAARTMLAAGAGFKMSRVRFDAGFAAVLEGSRNETRGCNPPLQPAPYAGCGPGGSIQPVNERLGPDPINPIVVPEQQLENPVNQGTFDSHYLMIMLGASTWF
jgi:long-subunit fatty acid transport protein